MFILYWPVTFDIKEKPLLQKFSKEGIVVDELSFSTKDNQSILRGTIKTSDLWEVCTPLGMLTFMGKWEKNWTYVGQLLEY
ncbi:MAG: hypothetical protein ACOX0T_02240 [Pelotomaculum sp.]